MTLRTYLLLLRPLRSLFVIAIVTFGAGVLCRVFFHLDKTQATVVALLCLLPTMLGEVIAGAAHEPMHRPFILVLPDSLRRLRRSTVTAIFVATLLVTGGVSFTDARIPWFASFGLVAGLIALPCLNRHQGMLRREKYALGLCRGTIFGLAAVGLLRTAMIVEPWAFLLGGIATAAASVAWGFSRRHLRERSITPYISMQTVVGSNDFSLNTKFFMEGANFRESLTKKAPKPGRDWTIQAVGSSPIEWMKVVWHTISGGSKSGSLFKTCLFYVCLSAVFGAITPFGISLLNFSTNGPGKVDYCEALRTCLAKDLA